VRTFLAPPPGPSSVGASASAPTFSVVIPAYQAAAFVAEAVESALTQTTPPNEVIVVDDGSTDDTRAALLPYQDRILFLQEEHRGVASARNTGIGRASGDFVAVLDADNVYLPEYFEALTELATTRPDLDILTTDAQLELEGDIYGRYYRGKARFVTDDQRRGIIHQHFVYANAAYRREALVAVGGYDEFYDRTIFTGEDTDLLVRLILSGSRAGLVDEPLCVYRIHGKSLSSNRPRSIRGGALVLERARSHPSLTADEIEYLDEQLSWLRIEADLAEAEEALRGLAGNPRARCLKIAFGPRRHRFRSRVSALAAALAPRAAGRYLERLEERSDRSRLALRTHGR
jgi:glycosyltransferase involved in cell wall biosynthesis